MEEKLEDRWYKVTERMPPLENNFFVPVWGDFRCRSIEIVKFTERKDDYFDLCECGVWYSLESEKGGHISHWRPMNRPERPEEEKTPT